MTTTVIFEIASDDEELRAGLLAVDADPLLKWQVAAQVCQMMLIRAAKAKGVSEHYDRKGALAAETRAARREETP